MKYHFRVHKEGKLYWAECLELEGLQTQAETRVDLQKNMVEALDLHLGEPDDSKLVFPLPNLKHSGRNIVEVQVSSRVAFAFMLRRMRLERRMTQKEVATAMHMKNLFSYQKLERPSSANPQLETLMLIKRVFPLFSIDAVTY